MDLNEQKEVLTLSENEIKEKSEKNEVNEKNEKNEIKAKKPFKTPHVFVILVGIALICALCSYFLPAGAYQMVEGPGGRMIADPESFSFIERTPVGFFEFFLAFPEGMRQAADIIFCIFIVGGAVRVIEATGAIEAGLGRIATKFMKFEMLIIPIIMAFFAICGATYGMAEEIIPFVPIMITLAMALGYDSITGTAMVLLGAGIGFTSALTNPFTVGVAQSIAELPMFSGIEFRMVMLTCMFILTTGYVMRYARRIKRNPQLSLVYDIDNARDDVLDLNRLPEFTARRKGVLSIFGLGIVGLVVGVLVWEWYIQEISALFLIIAIACGLVGKFKFSELAVEFANGMAGITGGALVVGFSRAILVVLTAGNLIHSLLYGMAKWVGNFPAVVCALIMFVIQSLLNFLIPSGSGQAAVSMPIMAPLADLVGVTRQTAVIAFQLGDGISNTFIPTSGYFMAVLAVAKVPYDKWLKWVMPLIGMQYLLGAVFVAIAQLIELGPF